MLSEDLRLFSKCINEFVRPFYSIDADKIPLAHWTMLRDSLSEGQLQSKLHLLDCLRKFCNEGDSTSDFSSSIKTISSNLPIARKHADTLNKNGSLTRKFKKAAFIGHWHGLLPLLFFEFGIIESAIGVELSTDWSSWSHRLNGHWNWKSTVADAAQFDFTDCDLIVNTSCEHMSYDWLSQVPAGCVLALQSTDYQIPEHANCVESVDEFKENILRHISNPQQNNLKSDRSSIYSSPITFLSEFEQKYEIYKRFTLIFELC